MVTDKNPLTDRVIGIPESRELDLFARMIETRGGAVVRCPLIAIRDTSAIDSVEHWLADATHNGLDTMIWMTGEGVRRMADFAQRLDYSEWLGTTLSGTTTITRGPKPVRALRDMGLRSDIAAPEPTTDGVIQALAQLELNNARVGLQLYGQTPNDTLQHAIRERGGQVLPVAPYVYADQADDDNVHTFINRIIADELDAIALTSAAQVQRLFAVADKRAQTDPLIKALETTCVGVVGPLVADSVRQAGVHVDVMPDGNYFLKPLVRALVTHFDAAS